ncbi:hypothetical protein AJ79_00813 [Helicocarpus griseus UAMH5409]|uniref:Restriction of telomere capping protein 4 n=1 Tax=Helicocarpus griseus UAMH5409 TaxID=1447875 RepID=A0A2B7Y1G7_9EURO|nr:hypothetical protein AJ79_00813 [Helicocarpus griseus UAMH5409]
MAQPRPNSSYATNYQTRRNYGGKPLLSVVGIWPTRSNTRDSASGDASVVQKAKREPATDDDPLSSSDESEQLSSHNMLSPSPPPKSGRKTFVSPDREEVADVDGEEGNRASKRRKKALDTPRTGERRSGRTKASEPTASPEQTRPKPLFKMDDGFFPPAVQPPKRRNTNRYGSNRINIHVAPKKDPLAKFKNPPSSMEDGNSAVHSSQASSNAPQFKNPLSFPDDIASSSLSTATQHFEDDDDDDDGYSSLSPLSSVSSSASALLTPTERARFDSSISKPNPIICPMCDKAIDPRFAEAEDSLSLKGLSYKRKAQFCISHNRRAAKQKWVDSGYPIIDWDNLHKRIEKHYAELDNILTCKTPSFYRKRLEDSQAQKKKGNMKLTVHGEAVEKLSTGYYGSRGEKKMMDAIINHFSVKFNNLAPKDSLIQAAGVSGFVQSVMIPELTVMLVKEDMNIGDDDARRIVIDSKDLGSLINEQPDDVIRQDTRR